MSKQAREASRRERVAAMQKADVARERNRRLLITLAIVVVLSAVVAAFVIFSGGGSTPPAAGAPTTKASGQALVVGSDGAKYKVVVYEDFLCPYCRELETSSRDFLRAAADKGTVQIEYRPFHLLQDDYSTRALAAWATVLQQGTAQQALRYHDLLYDQQPYEQDPAKPDAAKLAAWAKEAGVSRKSVLAMIGDPDDAFVNAADAAASKAGVTGTPTVLVNGQKVSGRTIAEVVDNLERMVAAG